MPPLTVILPFYDEISYLRSALNWISCQPLDNTQIIVVNDNPEEFDPATMTALTQGHRVELIQHPRNLGLSAARNSGLLQARGRYVGFLDSDDYYTQSGLANQLSRALETGADMVHAPTYFTQKGNPNLRILPRDASLFMQSRTANGLLDVEEAQFITSSWSSLYRRDFLTENALRFDEAQPRFEDRLFVLEAVTRARRIAFTGHPARVWRGRGGSISVSRTSPATHLLQLQLLEKCLQRIRTEVTTDRLPVRFERRELFNTVSRLIWDMDLVAAIAEGADPAYAEMAPRIVALLGSDTFGHAIFDDPVLSRISRVGMPTRKGRVTRTDFFSLHKALREGQFEEAAARLTDAPAASIPQRTRRTPARLILHLGLHKTGTTHIQHHLQHYRPALLEQGILVPQTGFDDPDQPLRDGAKPGHQGLASALQSGDRDIWHQLKREIRDSSAHTVILSCENMLFPTHADREERIARLAEHLAFDHVTPLVLARRPDRQIESYYREVVVNGARTGGRGIGAFLVDHGPTLADYPTLFTPVERCFGTRVRLADFDALKGRLWSGFCALAELPDTLPALDLPRYPTPDRDTVLLLELLNRLVPGRPQRQDILRGWFNLRSQGAPDQSLLPPTARRRLIDDWEERSVAFASARGYVPDLHALRQEVARTPWTAPEAIPLDMLHDLFDAAAMADKPDPLATPTALKLPRRDVLFTVRLRPWAAGLLRSLKLRRA